MTVGRLPSIEGGIQPTIVDAKGDLITAVAADTPARIAVGANDTVLTADSTTATGLKWATPAGGSSKNWTLINTGGTSLSGSSTQITGLSSYDDLMILINNASFTTANATLYVTVNGVSSAAAYSMYGLRSEYTTTYSHENFTSYRSTFSRIQLTKMSSDDTSGISGAVNISGGKGTGKKAFSAVSAASVSGGNGQGAGMVMGMIEATTTISTIEIVGVSTTFDGGTVLVYGA